MAGTWTSQNKIRPGSYINFSSVPRPSMTVGDRGIGTMAIPLDWGAEGELIDVYSTDMLDGASLAKVGVTAFDAGAKLLNLMLSGCYLAKIYRLNKGGEKATATLGGLTATAKYSGVFGNKITVAISEADGVCTVTTYVDGTAQDAQTATVVQELGNNAFVSFSGAGALAVNAGMPLAGGTNGTGAQYPEYLSIAKGARWQTMAYVQSETEPKTQFVAFAKMMRETEGKYVQVVIAGHDADYQGVINADCGVELADGAIITADEATAWVAGITAGASMTQSNGSVLFPGAVRILNNRTNSEIEEALLQGKFILSTNSRGQIKVEDDINSLHTFTPRFNRDWRYNQVVRVMDEIGTTITDTWEQSYQHKIQNDENGRLVFKGDMLGYFNDLQMRQAITGFVSGDLDIMRGEDLDSVVSSVSVQPIVAMSKLYLDVFVRG